MTANERTIAPGAYVGWDGHRCQVVRVYPRSEKANLRTTIAGKTVGIMGVPYSELSAAPPPAAHVEAAGQALAGFLTNPRQIFEEGK